MRPYDGIDYQYKHNDAKQEESIQIIMNLIGLQPVPDELFYSLNFMLVEQGAMIAWLFDAV